MSLNFFQVLDCLEVDNNDPVKHSYESVLLAEKYEIVWMRERKKLKNSIVNQPEFKMKTDLVHFLIKLKFIH